MKKTLLAILAVAFITGCTSAPLADLNCSNAVETNETTEAQSMTQCKPVFDSVIMMQVFG